MVSITKVIDIILVLFLINVATTAPLDLGLLLQLRGGPTSSPLLPWYKIKVGEYLATQKPAWFIGIVWLEVFFLWPLSVLNLYALVKRPHPPPHWFRFTSLIYGASYAASLIPVTAEVIQLKSGGVPSAILVLYFLFIGCGALLMYRGSLTSPADTTPTAKKRT